MDFFVFVFVVCVFLFGILKVNLLGWNWLTALYHFQLYKIITWHICTLLHAHHPVQFPSSTIYLTLYPLCSPSIPFCSSNHHSVVHICEFIFVCSVSFTVTFCFILHIWMKSYTFPRKRNRWPTDIWKDYQHHFFSVIMKIQIKTTIRYHLTQVGMTIIKNTRNNKCWEGYAGNQRTFIYCC